MEYLGSLKESPSACYNMDESGGHYAKWNKPVTKGQIQVSLVSESSVPMKCFESQTVVKQRGWLFFGKSNVGFSEKWNLCKPNFWKAGYCLIPLIWVSKYPNS